jgi:hypothetical protein
MVNLPQKKLGIIVLTAFLAFTAFFAESFIVTSRNHEHDHDGADGCCSVCYKIELAQLVLEGLGRIGIIALIAGFITYTQSGAKKPAVLFQFALTPIALKVRLNF